METHFIDNYKEDLFGDGNNSVSDKEAYEAARHNASLVAACLIEKEHFVSSRNPPGKLSHSCFVKYGVVFVYFLGIYICIFRGRQLTPYMVFFSAF